MFINKPSFWGSVVLAALSFGSCSRLAYSPSEKWSYQAGGGDTPHHTAAPRKVYRYSIVPGGVYSGEELEQARRVDPVVAAHYVGFGSEVEVSQLNADLFVYVSYRKANKVYWTAQKVKVPKGEKILTDGKKMARTRCGNQLSLTPQKPVDKVESPELNLTEDGPLLASLPSPPLFLPAGVATPNLVPGSTGAGPATGGIAPVAGLTPGPSGAEVPVGGPNPIILPPGGPTVGPVLPGVPTTPIVPVCPSTGSSQTSGPQARAVDPNADNCSVTPVTPVTVPEPAAWGLLLLSSLSAGLIWRRRSSVSR